MRPFPRDHRFILYFIGVKNMDTELKKDIIDSLNVVKKIVNNNLDEQDNANEGLSTYVALSIIDMVVTNHIQLMELSEKRNGSRL
jgi:hypothetical protein